MTCKACPRPRELCAAGERLTVRARAWHSDYGTPRSMWAQKKTAVRGRASRTAVGGESENREALQFGRAALAVRDLCCFCNVFYITESALVNRKI